MESTPYRNQTREEMLEDLRRNPRTTLFVIGGGIQGMEFARTAARNGQDCILADRADFAAGTSSSSSKMAHGGVRYLEMLDFQQVREGLAARSDLFTTARHLCRPAPFLIPVPRGDWRIRLKLGIGMTLYDRLGPDRSLWHRFIPSNRLRGTGFESRAGELAGCYEYWDGLIQDDARLVIESMLDARRSGARRFNYLEVVSVTRDGPRFSVACRDRLGKDQMEIAADLVINCAGPWVPCIGPDTEALASQLRFSAGAHLLFDRAWSGPCLFLPLEEPGRYYFVWPHPSGGTMVGTTEREVSFPAQYDPAPTAGEVEEILGRLDRDLPEAGLNRQSLYYGFSGIRTLPLRGGAGGTGRLSRRHIWKWTESGLALLGGKLTTARWTAYEGYRMAAERLGLPAGKSLAGVAYPGSGTDSELRQLEQEMTLLGMSEADARCLVARIGIRARAFLDNEAYREPLTPGLYRGEVEMAMGEEQACTVEDILRRRTNLEYRAIDLNPAVEAVVPFAARCCALPAVEEAARVYRQRIAALRRALKGETRE